MPRLVRTIFDGRNSPPEVRLVLGEVVTLPGGGRLSAAPPSAAGDLPLPVHASAGLWPRRARRRGRQGTAVRHDQDHGRQRSCAGRRARLRDVLRLGDPPPAGQALFRSGVHRRSTPGPWRPAQRSGSRRRAPSRAASRPRGPSEGNGRLHLPWPRSRRSVRPRARHTPGGCAAFRQVPGRIVRQRRSRLVAPWPQGCDVDARRR